MEFYEPEFGGVDLSSRIIWLLSLTTIINTAMLLEPPARREVSEETSIVTLDSSEEFEPYIKTQYPIPIYPDASMSPESVYARTDEVYIFCIDQDGTARLLPKEGGRVGYASVPALVGRTSARACMYDRTVPFSH